MPNIPVDWAAVDWTNVALLSVIAFVAALLGNVLIFRHRLWAAVLAGLLFAAAYVFLVYYPHGLTVPGLKTGARAAPAVVGFNLTSPEIAAGATIQNEQVYRGFGCNGTNISPELRWANAPGGTKGFGLTVYDPDAPTGSGWWHWLIVNIPATATFLPRNAGDPKMGLAPPGTLQLRNDFGTVGYGGPCPPPGDRPHRYLFTIFALDIEKLPIDDTVSAAAVGFNLNAHTLKKATLTGFYGR
jgi:Raf kinase inhibitor-like YbhB/YbcL family protein